MRQHPTRANIWVADDGRIFLELTPSKDDAGYHQIRNGDLRERRHVIVCETFHGPRPPGMVVRHRDGDAGNDHPNNLEWGTPLDNVHDTIRHGRFPQGVRSGTAKLNEEQVKEIRMRRRAGESLESIAAEFNISPQRVCDLSKGRGWRHVKAEVA
jgi:hypothetical protein